MCRRAGGDEPNASMASGMVLKAGLEVPFGCWWEGDIVGGCLEVFFLAVFRLTLQWYLQCMYRLDNGLV